MEWAQGRARSGESGRMEGRQGAGVGWCRSLGLVGWVNLRSGQGLWNGVGKAGWVQVEGETLDSCENITLPQTTYVGSNDFYISGLASPVFFFFFATNRRIC